MDLAADYHGWIAWTLATAGMSDTLAHVHVGMAIYLVSQFVLRTRRASLKALTIVFALEAVNETMDRLYAGSWRWADTLGDFAATMFWPTVLVLFGQYRRRRFARAQAHRAFLEEMRLRPYSPVGAVPRR